MKSRIKISLLLISIFFCSNLSAHPHVFISAKLKLCFVNDTMQKIEVEFLFDKMFSNDLLMGFDKNGDKYFDASEMKDLEKNAFSNLANYSYFIHITDGNVKKDISKVSDFRAELNDNEITYKFNVYTNIGVGTNPKTLKIAVYDHSYFIAVNVDHQGIEFEGIDKDSFSYNIIEDSKQAYYYNQIYPECIVVRFK